MNTFFEWMNQDTSIRNCGELFYKAGRHCIYGVGGSVKAALLGLSLQQKKRPVILIVPGKEQQAAWLSDLALFAPSVAAIDFPLTDNTGFVTMAKSMERAARQTEVLGLLAQHKPCVVVATAESAAQFVVSPDVLRQAFLEVEVHKEYNRSMLLKHLVDGGYERVDMVERRGHFSVRGDIVDIFAVNYDQPLRMEFFGDDVDSIRIFDRVSQKSLKQVDKIHLLPLMICDNRTDDNTVTLLNYAESGLILWDEPNRIRENLKALFKEDTENKKYFCSWKTFCKTPVEGTQIILSLLAQSVPDMIIGETASFTAKTMASFQKQFMLLQEELIHWKECGNAVVFVLGGKQKADSLQSWLRQNDMEAGVYDGTGSLDPQGLYILDGELCNGFEIPFAHLVVLSERDIYGMQKHRLHHNVEKGKEINIFTDLKSGDYVVHEIHGIGKYIGIKTIELEDVHKDYLEIHYAGKDTLYVPTEQVNLLQRYIGNEGEIPKLHKMGGSDWQKTKAKVQKSVTDLANKLVEIYANREITPGFAFPPDTPWQKEFEEAFPYEETADQLKAVADIKMSMEKPFPMDRLICGDVGFGKTEVALRAVFKAVMGGKQVAVLVPTTVLSQQHFQTFTERFRRFGVTCDVMNRFRSVKEKKSILARLITGDLDVLIGTHSLLSKKVRFKDLGLLIVDEEQRFGVAQKEKWKAWASAIDVLTLSATPIPRTLHMSLVGVREMSVIETPPVDRFPVQTYVVEYEARLVREAVMREKRRGGQVFFVYNRVASIERMKDELQALMPEITIGVAHGQMPGTVLEHVMFDYYEGRYDMLLCSSLVENGLDVANANTIIVCDADHFGLSQLYQMRGRVGRSHRLAYAYFLYRRDKVLSEVAEKRLQAIKEFTELGSGFKIAMRDLEIRGAGNILGREQHGSVASVGFAMYCHMLEKAIVRAQNGSLPETPSPETVMDIHLDAFIDEAYIANGGQKIEMYQRLATLNSEQELDTLTDEMIDRYGTPTRPVETLLRATAVRMKGKQLGLTHIVEKKHFIELKWQRPQDIPPLAKLETKLRRRLRMVPNSPMTLFVSLEAIPDVLRFLEYLFQAMTLLSAGKGESRD